MKNITVHDLYDQHTSLIMRTILRKDSCCIDIGAHVGAILSEIIGLCPEGRHYAFEPLPKLAAELKRRFPSVDIYDVALSDEEGAATFFHVENDPAYSGLKKRRYDISDPVIREIRVPIARLDSVVPPRQRIDFIKIDVEGGELPVLRGAQRILEENSPSIIFESGKGASDFYGTTGEALFDLLAGQHRLELYTLDGFLSGCLPLTRPKLVDIFDRTSRYYFIAVGRKHFGIELADRLNSYLLDLDLRLVELERRLPKKAITLQVIDWGPRRISLTSPVNVQPDGCIGMWFCLQKDVSDRGDLRVRFGDQQLPVFGEGAMLTTGVPLDSIKEGGSIAVEIEHEPSKATIFVGNVTILISP